MTPVLRVLLIGHWAQVMKDTVNTVIIIFLIISIFFFSL